MLNFSIIISIFLNQSKQQIQIISAQFTDYPSEGKSEQFFFSIYAHKTDAGHYFSSTGDFSSDRSDLGSTDDDSELE